MQPKNGAFKTLKEKIKALKDDFKFADACKILEAELDIKKEASERIWINQQLALCTYKNKHIHPEKRFADALEILEGIGLRDGKNIQGDDDEVAETLSLGGAVYKRRWETGGQIENLNESLVFYEKAHEKKSRKYPGYGGINAAYILQILEFRVNGASKRSGTDNAEGRKLEERARALRKDVADFLNNLLENDPAVKKDYWFTVTLAEAYFGLDRFDEAKDWLEQGAGIQKSSKESTKPEWEIQTTFRQLVSIARMKGIELPKENEPEDQWDKAWQCLNAFLDGNAETAFSCYRGKPGLALSGGGFRASLYHLGVLARLAEMDVLRGIEVLSTVSGGSIVGAQYYLEVKQLIETKKDEDITKKDYIDLVKKLQQDFLSGIQKNIRALVFSDASANYKMIKSDNYSRSNRLGELYEGVLYSGVKDGFGEKTRYMKDLLIKPAPDKEDFNPAFSNWRRRAKVPALLINATSLNTGHNWRFTALSMGEPPALTGSKVDKNARYRRIKYASVTDKKLKEYPLGNAVAASSCVPGVFEPLVLNGGDSGKIQLVDGGVHDNQGVEGLLDEGCTLIFASDASGQMKDEKDPSDKSLQVLLRTNSVIMDRVREAEYQNLRSRVENQALQGLFFVHLKKDFPVEQVNWNGQAETPQDKHRNELLPYNINLKFQKLMANIRTDLDAFSEVESYALMCSGYLMTKQQFQHLQEEHTDNKLPGAWGGYDIGAKQGEWEFLTKMENLLEKQPDSDTVQEDLTKQLEVASKTFFKFLCLSPIKTFPLFFLFSAVPATLLLWLFFAFSFTVSISTVGIFIVVIIIGVLAGLNYSGKIKLLNRAVNIASKAVIYPFLYMGAKIHLRFFNRIYLKQGEFRFLKTQTTKGRLICIAQNLLTLPKSIFRKS